MLEVPKETLALARYIPVIVPCTTVPFFSSICTLSLVSFMRNLNHRECILLAPTREHSDSICLHDHHLKNRYTILGRKTSE